jgi:predicted metal-binding protein
LEEKVSNYPKHVLVYIKRDTHHTAHNNASLKEEFEREMLSAAEQVRKKSTDIHLLWGGHCTLCHTRLGKNCSYDFNEPCRFPEEIRYSMEAVGINVDSTVQNVNMSIEWPPTDYIYKFGLISYTPKSQGREKFK